MTTLPEEAVKAAQSDLSRIISEWERNREFLNVTPEAKKNFMRRQASALTALDPSASRALSLEEIIALCKDYAEDSQPDSEYRLACNDIIEAIQERRALSSPDHADAGKVEGDGIERAKFYHHQWPMKRLLEARRDGLVDHSGGEAWRYEYSHKDEHGKYDILYRPVKNSTIPARLPSAPASEGAE